MTDDRWVVLGLAHPRASWFSDLARWSTAAAVPVDFIKCVSADEVRARLATGRPYSALLIGGDANGLDRDLVDTTVTAGAVVIVVDPPSGRDWAELGASALLPATFERTELVAALREHAPPISRVSATPSSARPTSTRPDGQGRLISVSGPGGSGTSTLAMAIAQALGSDAGKHSMVLLADLALDADQAMLHDARDVVPGIQELVEAHRIDRLSTEAVRALTFDAIGRGYHLLLGLRRHRDWTAIRTRAFAVSLDGLLRSYRWVVADVSPDVEGEPETGSIDVEDRNLIARTVQARADLNVVTGTAGVKGLHSVTRMLRELVGFGVPTDRLLPVITRTPRSPRRRAEITEALRELLAESENLRDLRKPVFVPERNDLEAALRDGVRLPRAIGAAVTTRIEDAIGDLPPRTGPTVEPVAVVPGSLGSWAAGDAG